MIDIHTGNVCGIRQKSTGYWWQRNTEHGSGWSDGRIRQAWTPREANIEFRQMIEWGIVNVTDVEIVELGPKGEEDDS